MNSEWKEQLDKLGLNRSIDELLEKQYKSYDEEIQKVVGIAVDDQKYLWNETVKKYATKVEKVKQLLQQEGIEEQFSQNMINNLDVFLNRCCDRDFHIALVGAIKAGKSTLINALLGMDIASTAVTPETASLTKFRHSDTNNYIKISFYSVDEWSKLWQSAIDSKAEVFLEEYEEVQAEAEKKNWLGKEAVTIDNISTEELKEEIKKWTSSKYATHYFVKEVEVGLKKFIVDNGIVLVDTPGLDDVVEYRSNITRDYINRANAVLVCVRSDSLTGGELSTILGVFANTKHCPEKVFTVATQVDTLNRPVEDWKSQKIEWIKYLKRKGAYGSQDLASKNIIGTSAYLYNLLRNMDHLTEDEDETLRFGIVRGKYKYKKELVKDDDMFKTLRSQTGVIQLRNQMQEAIINNYRVLQVKDIEENFNICKAELMTDVARVKKQQVELMNLADKSIEEIKAKRIECENALKKEKKETEALNGLLEKLYKVTIERAERLSESMKKLYQ